MAAQKRIHPEAGAARKVIARALRFMLLLMLSACASQPQGGTASPVTGGGETAGSEECSFVGTMACKATALFSGGDGAHGAPTCVVLRNATGARIESCAGMESAAPATAAKRPAESFVSVRLGWSDNSNDENRFIIERCDRVAIKEEGGKKTGSCDGIWTAIGAVLANITSYVDHTARPNHTYLYRIKADNEFGSSGYTNEALITAPAK